MVGWLVLLLRKEPNIFFSSFSFLAEFHHNNNNSSIYSPVSPPFLFRITSAIVLMILGNPFWSPLYQESTLFLNAYIRCCHSTTSDHSFSYTHIVAYMNFAIHFWILWVDMGSFWQLERVGNTLFPFIYRSMERSFG